ncbi:GSCFA domain-containing protein [Synechococcus sp. A10-1-5-1]|uniref:GSCFA domain-containing protein n=1 Tax=Synechococcus sp. A10-1-5-1 TaxID=2936507 RepID=UPI002001301E|nr:GSCFA domain-containing protein [Synechococcus sp. A10-1-5-1]UPM51375.1 GSCFA domain-containing protein [Synechococcus sp. A10-1-5-1]
MGKNPYSDLPKSAFWKTGVAQENPYAIEGIYKKKFDIPASAKIATAGSCFAQHISRHLKKNGYNVLDVEPPPPGLPKDLHQKFGFSMYSARYGNIYTVRQLLQLAQEVAGEWTPQNYIWEKNGKFFDALRPAVEPEGLDSPEEVAEHRRYHVSRVKKLLESLDLFIFTLGLTEMWAHKESGTVYPTAPGTLVGNFDDDLFEFQNSRFGPINSDMKCFVEVLRRIRGGKSFQMILTVSPVPLTATASGHHVLPSTVYSKSTLRAIAGLWADRPFVDYFPSYEIVTNPRMHSTSFADNLRSVRDETVEVVMRHFFSEHSVFKIDNKALHLSESNQQSIGDIQCEDALLEAFSR